MPTGLASGIRAGAAYIELFTKDSKLVRGLNSAVARVKAFGASISALASRSLLVGAAIAAPMLEAAKTFADTGAELFEMSRRTGISVEALSELAFAAKRSGTDLETLEGGLRKLQQAIGQAANGSAEAQSKLVQLGLRVEDLINLSPDAQFERVADALSVLPTQAQRTAAAMDLMGKSASMLLPMMDELGNLRQQARASGGIWSTEDARRAKDLQLALGSVSGAMKKVFIAIGSAVAPALRDLFGQVVKLIRPLRDLAVEHAGLFRLLGVVTAGMLGWGMAVKVVSALLSGFAVAWNVVTAAVGAAVSAITFMLSPIGALTLAVGGVVTVLISASDVAQRAFGAIGTAARTAFAGVNDALAAGNWELAMRIAWAGIKAAFAEGVIFLKGTWQEFTSFFVELWNGVATGMMTAMVDLWGAIHLGFVELKSAALATLIEIDKLNPFTGTDWRGRREADIAQERADIRAERDDEKARIRQLAKFAEDQRAAERQAEVDRLREQIGKEQDELNRLREEAARAKANMPAAGALEQVRQGVDVAIQQARRVGIAGAFDTARIPSALAFGTDKVDEKQLDEQIKIRKGMDKVAAAAVAGGIAFWK